MLPRSLGRASAMHGGSSPPSQSEVSLRQRAHARLYDWCFRQDSLHAGCRVYFRKKPTKILGHRRDTDYALWRVGMYVCRYQAAGEKRHDYWG